MTRLLHRAIHATPPIAAGGKGIELIDSTGRAYGDASGGVAVSCLGHGHRVVIDALHEQVERLAYAHTALFTSEPAEELAELLVADAPAGLSHAYLVSGGSEAIGAALKMARQYFVEKGEPQRRHVIARRQSYHGNTLGTIDGRRGDHVLLAPPYIVDRSDIGRIVERLGDAIDAAVASIPAPVRAEG
jgi:adenosylmethionine-8-amino-7-oxononanoate aminotransferase